MISIQICSITSASSISFGLDLSRWAIIFGVPVGIYRDTNRDEFDSLGCVSSLPKVWLSSASKTKEDIVSLPPVAANKFDPDQQDRITL